MSGLRGWLARRTASPVPESGHVSPGRASTPDLASRRAFLARHVLIHTHVPKTAGATLASGLAAIVGGVNTMDLRLKRSIPLDRLSEEDLGGLSLVSGHFPYGLHARFPDRTPLYVAAVREPADRSVSDYRFLATHADYPGHEEAASQDFETWESLHRERRPNEQSRMLLGERPGSSVEADEAITHADEAYFLIIPQPEMTRAVRSLRAAFGVAWAPVASTNVSVGHEVVLDSPTREAIRHANDVDTALYEHVLATFDTRLAGACDYIAEHCLEALPDGRRHRRGRAGGIGAPPPPPSPSFPRLRDAPCGVPGGPWGRTTRCRRVLKRHCPGCLGPGSVEPRHTVTGGSPGPQSTRTPLPMRFSMRDWTTSKKALSAQ